MLLGDFENKKDLIQPNKKTGEVLSPGFLFAKPVKNRLILNPTETKFKKRFSQL